MVEYPSWSRRLFVAWNYTFLITLSILCILPLVHVFAISLSENAAVAAGYVSLWPVQFTWASYEYVMSKPEFLTSIGVTLQRVLIGVPVNIGLSILLAYPLSKEVKTFRWRTVYAWILVFTMLFNGGLIPLYMTVKDTGLLNSLWAMVLPTAVPVFSVILLLNFFRGLPLALEEAALMDGANHWTVMWRIFVPLSMPAIATITLFSAVFHWNSWFDGMIFMNSTDNYPLQSYLRTVVIQLDLSLSSVQDLTIFDAVSDRTSKAAQIFLGSLPILLVYPFLQRYFMKGIVLGSVKE